MDIIEAAQELLDGKKVAPNDSAHVLRYEPAADAIICMGGFWSPSPAALLATNYEVVQ